MQIDILSNMYSKASFVIFLLVFTINSHLSFANKINKEVIRQAEALLKDGEYKKAYDIYENALSKSDSVFYLYYDSEVSEMYDQYDVTDAEINNQIQSTRISRIEVISSFLVLFLIISIFCILSVNTSKLKSSQTELKKAIKLLNYSIKSKSYFLSNTSHEIRTPLNALVGFSQLLSDENTDHESAIQYNEIIKLNANLLIRLINDVIDISCLDISDMKFELKPVEITSLCKKVIETISRIKKTEVQIKFVCEKDNIVIISDSVRLQQIIINLLGNAIKFCNKGTITLEVKEKDQMLYFIVSDTGIGIPKEKMKDLFLRFGKLDELSNGTGLGLSICKIIINRLGGDISIDEEYKEGARFVVTHPINNNN
ncbi:MAG: HAMP domain-containing sensor histidine kinase [Bacteroidales bacterium]|nr:HAMP domain-containing sensor histidine kinase [Bacteroidales bacterium]